MSGGPADQLGHSLGAFSKCSSVLSLSHCILAASAAAAADALEYVDDEAHRSSGEGQEVTDAVDAAGSTRAAVAGLVSSTWAAENSIRV